MEELREQLESEQRTANPKLGRLHVLGEMEEVPVFLARKHPDAEFEEELHRVERARHVVERCQGTGILAGGVPLGSAFHSRWQSRNSSSSSLSRGPANNGRNLQRTGIVGALHPVTGLGLSLWCCGRRLRRLGPPRGRLLIAFAVLEDRPGWPLSWRVFLPEDPGGWCNRCISVSCWEGTFFVKTSTTSFGSDLK